MKVNFKKEIFTCEKQWSSLAWIGLDKHHLHLGPLPKKDINIKVKKYECFNRRLNTFAFGVYYSRKEQICAKLHSAQFASPHLLKKIFQQLIELVHQFIQELAASNVYPVEDGEFLVAESVVGLRAGLQHISVGVLLHNLPDLSQQWFQMLKMREQQHITSPYILPTNRSTANKENMILYFLFRQCLNCLYTKRLWDSPFPTAL